MKVLKKYRSDHELLDHLRDDKNIIDIHNHRDLILNRTYVSSINPYKKIFSIGIDQFGNHLYRPRIFSEDYKKLIQIDDLFAGKYFQLIGVFERKLKLLIINKLCNQMNEIGDQYCIEYPKQFLAVLNNEDLSFELPYKLIRLNQIYTKNGIVENPEKTEHRTKILEKLVSEGTKEVKAKNILVRHYQTNYEVVPFWLLAQILTLGDTGLLFDMLSDHDRYLITKAMRQKDKIYIKDVLVFSSIIDEIRTIRNLISHYEPVFPRFLSMQRITVFDYLLTFSTLETPIYNMQLCLDEFKNNYNQKHIDKFEKFISYLNKKQ